MGLPVFLLLLAAAVVAEGFSITADDQKQQRPIPLQTVKSTDENSIFPPSELVIGSSTKLSRIRRKLTPVDSLLKFLLSLLRCDAKPVQTTTRGRCRTFGSRKCRSDCDCCQWDTPDYKLFQSCSDTGKCNCLAPTTTCREGLRCCDGSLCSGKCPPAALYHHCYNPAPSVCASGLTCIEDSIGKKLWPSKDFRHGRCLPEKTTSTSTTTTTTTTITSTPTTTTSTTTPTTTSDRCRIYENQNCQSDSDCCQWDTPEYKLFQSCGTDNSCWCVSPGDECYKGYICCDGSVCNGKCPPVPKFHFCKTIFTPNCMSGLECVVDSASLALFPTDYPDSSKYGRCMPQPKYRGYARLPWIVGY